MQLAKDGLIAYNKDRKRKAIPPRRTARSSGIAPKKTRQYRKGDGLYVEAAHVSRVDVWFSGAPPYGLPEEMYNDVMPSGVHRYNRYNDGL